MPYPESMASMTTGWQIWRSESLLPCFSKPPRADRILVEPDPERLGFDAFLGVAQGVVGAENASTGDGIRRRPQSRPAQGRRRVGFNGRDALRSPGSTPL